jgi:hypothetical protein
LEHNWNCLRLDGRWQGVAHLGDGTINWFCKSEIRKLHKDPKKINGLIWQANRRRQPKVWHRTV